MKEGEYRPHPIQPDHIQPQQEGGNGAPSIQPTLNERSKPPSEGSAQGGSERPGGQRDDFWDSVARATSLSPLSEEFHQQLGERLRQISQKPEQEQPEQNQPGQEEPSPSEEVLRQRLRERLSNRGDWEAEAAQEVMEWLYPNPQQRKEVIQRARERLRQISQKPEQEK